MAISVFNFETNPKNRGLYLHVSKGFFFCLFFLKKTNTAADMFWSLVVFDNLYISSNNSKNAGLQNKYILQIIQEM